MCRGWISSEAGLWFILHSLTLQKRPRPLFFSVTPPNCGELMRNRMRLQSLIEASSGNRPLAGCSFLSLTSRYSVFPQHHYTPLLLSSSLLTCQPLWFLFLLFLPVFSFSLSFVTQSVTIGDIWTLLKASLEETSGVTWPIKNRTVENSNQPLC